MQILKEIMASKPGYSMPKQIYDGIVKTIPFIIAYFVCYFLRGVLDEVMTCLLVVSVCKIAAAPINPLPQWKFDKLGVEDYSAITDNLTELVKKLLKRGDNE